jgi:ubiquinone/menaquinone biosynthesis C-methylase UbiE
MTTMDWSAQGGTGPSHYQQFLVPAMFDPFAATLMEQAGVEPGSRVLDVACGTGAASRAAARTAGPDGSVTGVDLGEPTLAVARSFAAEDGAAPITFVQADATALPVEDASFDVAICQQGFQFFPDKPTALAEMRRALKPGGRLAIATWTDPRRNPIGAVIEALERHVGTEAAQTLNSPFALPAAELERLIAEAGFEDVELRVEEQVCTWKSPPGEFAQRTIAAGPLAPAFAAAPEDVQQAVAATTGERLAKHVSSEGDVRMPMVSNVALARAPGQAG